MINKSQLIELIYDDEVVAQGEALYLSAAVLKLSKSPNNLFVARVLDGKTYEVEVMSPFAKKQTTSCDCEAYQKNKICKHILAVLFKIREEKKLKIEEKVSIQDKIKNKNLTSLNINQILEEIDTDDLILFVKNHAKTDRKFSTQLKVNFARKIEVSDNAEKYKTILNSMVRANTGVTKSSATEIKAILNVLDDFADQINDCLALKQFREAFNIYEAAFAKLAYIKHYYTFHSDYTLTLDKRYHTLISDFASEKLPPTLRDEIIKFLLDLAQRSYYDISDINFNIYAFLQENFKKQFLPDLSKVVSELIPSKSGKEKLILTALYIRVNGKFGSSEKDFLKPFENHILEIIDLLINSQQEIIALKVLNTYFKKEKYNKEINNRLIFLFIRLKQRDELIAILETTYMQSGEIKYLDILNKEQEIEAYNASITRMITEIKKRGLDAQLLLRIFKKNEDWESALEYMFELRSIEQLMIYDQYIFKINRKELIELYKMLIIEYLEEHIGDTSYIYLQKLIYHFRIKGMEAMIKPIFEILKLKFAHRVQLLIVMDDLD